MYVPTAVAVFVVGKGTKKKKNSGGDFSHPLLVGHVVALPDVVLRAPFLRDLFDLGLHARELGVIIFAVVLSSPRRRHDSRSREGGGRNVFCEDMPTTTASPERECQAFFSSVSILNSTRGLGTQKYVRRVRK